MKKNKACLFLGQYNTVKHKRLHSPTILAVAVLGIGHTVQALALPAAYTITDLGIIPSAINNNGQIIGSNYFLYNTANNTLTNIKILGDGSALSAIYDINYNGQVVGMAANLAVVRDANGNGLGLGVLPSDATSVAYAINDGGQVVGMSAPSAVTPCTVHAFLGNVAIAGTPLSDLGALGGTRNYANDINNNGHIVGKSTINPLTDCSYAAIYHAYIGTLNGLRDLQGSGMLGNSAAYKSNTNGQVVGDFANGLVTKGISAYYPTGYPINHAVVWNTAGNTYRDLGNGSKDSSLRAINANGQMVGFERTYSDANFGSTSPLVVAQNAVVADNNSGGLVDLNTLVVGMPTGWSLKIANDINDAGQIIASAKDAFGYTRGVLLTPSTTPPPPQLPPAPTNLTPKVVSGSQINLSWQDNATDETTQYLERCLDASCSSFTPIATLAANVTNYTDTALTPATNYWYRVKAHNASGDSAYSTIAAATTWTSTPTLPADPTNLYSPAISRKSVILYWTDNATNETGYLLERCERSNCNRFNVIKTLAVNSTSYTDTSLSSNTNYSYRVRASNAIGTSAYSNTLSVKTLP